jgi:methionine-rich copper-binding protein CopC
MGGALHEGSACGLRTKYDPSPPHKKCGQINEHPMKNKLLTLMLAAALVGSSPAFAHGGMMETSIQDMASLAQAPAEFKVTFQHESAITSLMLMDANKKMIAVDFKPSKTMGKEFTIPLPTLAKGSYTLSWKSVARDGHAMPGAVRFTVTGQ